MVTKDGWTALRSDTSLDTIDPDQQQSMAVLHTACLAGYSNIVSHLLSLSSVRGLVNNQDSCGNIALMDAARAGHLDCVEHLLATNTIDTRLRDKMGRSVLEVSAEAETSQVLSYLRARLGLDMVSGLTV